MALLNIRIGMGRIRFSWLVTTFLALIVLITTSGKSKAASVDFYSLLKDDPVGLTYDDKFPVSLGSTTKFVPRDDFTWETAVSKGTNALCLLEATTAQDLQSTWTDYATLAENGWDIDTDYSPVYADSLDDVFEALGINDGDNVPVAFSSDRPATINGVTFLPSTGQYKNVYNGEQGVIIADDNLSPFWALKKAEKPNQPYAPLSRWSDIVFLEWQEQAENVANLKYVFRASISNGDTQNMIVTALGNSKLSLLNIGGYGNAKTFDMGTDEGKAILGTPNGQGVGWLLIQHKSQMGLMTIQSVTVWAETACSNPNTACISMFFTIVPVSSQTD